MGFSHLSAQGIDIIKTVVTLASDNYPGWCCVYIAAVVVVSILYYTLYYAVVVVYSIVYYIVLYTTLTYYIIIVL